MTPPTIATVPPAVVQHLALQPAIHRLVGCLSAPSVTLSDAEGRITGVGAQGFFLGERRLLSEYMTSAYGRAPEVLQSVLGADGILRVTAVVRDGSELNPDPVLVMRQTREQHPAGFSDVISLHNVGAVPRRVPIALSLAADLAPTATLKAGELPPATIAAAALADGIRFESGGYFVDVTSAPAPLVDRDSSTLCWDVLVEPGGRWEARIDVRGAQPDDGAFRPLPARRIPWIEPIVRTDSAALSLLTDWSFGDLRRLALADPLAPDDTFIAAGCPWYFTLFGRDSLWTARMMLPFGTELAAATVRALARRQGTRDDVYAAEQPGRIPHELRPATFREGELSLPSVYYGSVDATPLWITTLVEAWRWGLPDADVEPLLDALQAAVRWLVDDSDPDGDGLCEYIDRSGTGLSNQGWKDSGDSVNWHDGRLATAPIALVEVQGYAYEAALNAMQLYEHFGLPGAERLRWFVDDDGPHLAIALDADKRAVDSTTSNPGHVLGTGLLSAEQEAVVVERLMTELDCGVGLRTMSSRDGRYNPLSYHNGSVWPHDTAICARGMVLAGKPGAAGELLRGLLTAAMAFEGRLPELFGSIDEVAGVVPYPASCRPQAWAAAAGAVALWAAAPLRPSAPGVAPEQLAGVDVFGPLDIDGFSFGGARISARVADGVVTFSGLDPAGVPNGEPPIQ
jgi:N-terminal domain of (some) glycogen debranching enzymes/Amylo-alpha-1,6-glucosidase